MKASANAPAKINLYLDVMQKRPDSFHDIKSIMHTVRLSDTVTVETKSGGGICLSCSNPELPTDSRNLAFRAAELFFERTGINGACEIHIEKNIPVAGGLAGGSTDAAAVLKLLNALCKEPLDQAALWRLGAEIGSDVPFCISGGCALCTGRGEIMTPLPVLPETLCVIANAGEGVSTPEAYKMLDDAFGERLSDNLGDIDAAVSAVERGDMGSLYKSAFNIFEDNVLAVCPKARRIRDEFSECGATLSMMSGSGSTVFALFESEDAARRAVQAARAGGAFCVLTVTG